MEDKVLMFKEIESSHTPSVNRGHLSGAPPRHVTPQATGRGSVNKHQDRARDARARNLRRGTSSDSVILVVCTVHDVV